MTLCKEKQVDNDGEQELPTKSETLLAITIYNPDQLWFSGNNDV